MSNKKVIKMPGGAQQTNAHRVPSKEEVQAEARRAVLPDLSKVAESLGGRIAVLYAETAKTAVILNSLAELLISKKIIGKDELQAISMKNGKDLEDQYRAAVEKTAGVKSGGEKPIPVPAEVTIMGEVTPLPKAPTQEKPDGGQSEKPAGAP